jgi:hypothetical protein
MCACLHVSCTGVVQTPQPLEAVRPFFGGAFCQRPTHMPAAGRSHAEAPAPGALLALPIGALGLGGVEVGATVARHGGASVTGHAGGTGEGGVLQGGGSLALQRAALWARPRVETPLAAAGRACSSGTNSAMGQALQQRGQAEGPGRGAGQRGRGLHRVTSRRSAAAVAHLAEVVREAVAA